MAVAKGPVLARVLVTGGQGFVGAYVLRHLLSQKSAIAVFDIDKNWAILRQILSDADISRIHFFYGDIVDASAVKKAILEFEPTAVIHLAGVQIPTVKSNPGLGSSVNVTGTANVFEAVHFFADQQNSDPIPISYASSAAVLGPTSDYPDGGKNLPAESHVHKPRTLYGVYKLCCERIAHNFWEEHGIPSVGLRPLTVFGVGREIGLTSGPTKAVKAAVLGQPFVLEVSGTTGFQYVSDVARLFCDAASGIAIHPGSQVCGVRGHLASCEEFLQEASRVLPQVAKLATIQACATDIPIHYDVDEEPLRKIVGRDDLHIPLGDAISDMVRMYKELQNLSQLHDTDLRKPPSKF